MEVGRGYGFGYSIDIEVDGDYVYLLSKIEDSLKIISVSNKSSPYIVGEISGADNYLEDPVDVEIVDSFAFFGTVSS